MKKIIVTLALNSLAISCFASDLFSIVPNVNPVSVRSDGSAVVHYTVKNINTVKLSQIYLQALNTPKVSFQSLDDTCSGASLAPGDSCGFNVLIQGSNAPSSPVFPTICAANGVICDVPKSPNELTVNVLPVTGGAHAYLSVLGDMSGEHRNQVVSASTLDPSSPVSAFGNSQIFNFQHNGLSAGGIAVSRDGQYAYVVDAGNARLDILALNQGRITSIVHSVSVGNTDDQAIVINSAGTRAYVSSDSFIYTINISDVLDPFVVTGSTLSIDSQTFSMAISPDGSTLYVPCAYGNSNGTVEVFNVANDHNNLLQRFTYTTPAVPFAAEVSPDGTKVYISTNAQNNGGVSEILDANDSSNMRFVQQLVALPGVDGTTYPEGLTVSSDGSELYVVENGSTQWQGHDIPGVAMIDLKSLAVHKINFPTYSFPVGVDLNPDDSKLFVSNEQSPPLYVVDLKTLVRTPAFNNDSHFGSSLVRSNFVN